MFALKPLQLQQIEGLRFAGLEARTAVHLEQYFGFRFAGDGPEGALAFARRAVAHARSIGLRHEGTVMRYAGVAALVGIGFEASEAAGRHGLAVQPGESADALWIDRIVPLVEAMLRARDAR